MATQRIPYDEPRIPMRHASWFIRLLTVLAVLILAGVVYGFWSIAKAPSPAPTIEVPGAAPQPQAPPTNDQAP